MEAETALKFRGATETLVDPVVLGATLLGILLILLLPRERALFPILLIALLTPASQRLVVGGLNFMMIRILLLFGWVRILLSPSLRSFSLTVLDRLVIAWLLSNSFFFILHWGESGAVINRMGYLYSMLGSYLLFRAFLRGPEDVGRALRWLAAISGVIACSMLIEQATGRNLFSVFGGVPEFTAIREGRLRSMGPFSHPILAGTFGAAVAPLFLADLLGAPSRGKARALAGFLSAVAITVTSASSGPLVGFVAGVGALALWKARFWTRTLFWGAIALLAGLHLAMKAPVWALISRISLVEGSTSYHRYLLIDQFLSRIGEWWLMGVKSTADWGWMMWDTSNQFVQEGVDGGLLTLLLFLAMLLTAFRSVGRTVRASADPATAFPVWVLGSSLFAMVVGFFGISYFDQMSIILLFVLAAISTSTAPRPEAGEGAPAAAKEPA